MKWLLLTLLLCLGCANESENRFTCVVVCSECDVDLNVSNWDTTVHVLRDWAYGLDVDSDMAYSVRVSNFGGYGDGYLTVSEHGEKVYKEHRDQILHPKEELWTFGTVKRR